MENKRIIMKFGGTSVGSPENIKKAIDVVSNAKSLPIGIVVSAFTKVTNQLLLMAQYALQNNKEYRNLFRELSARHFDAITYLIKDNQRQEDSGKQIEKLLQELESILLGVWVIKELSPKTLDLILSFGERLSAYVITQSFLDRSFAAECIDTKSVIKTNNNFNNAKVNFKKTNKLIKSKFGKRAQKTIIKIIPGFIGSTDKGEVTTLGRGGSDYTTSIFGAALDVDEIQLWTDVSGVMTADPKKVTSAFTIKKMSYLEAMEMSHFGAKVIHPPTMIPAMEKHIPIVIKNTFHPSETGTIIADISSEEFPIKGISSISDITVLLIQGSGMVGVPGVAMRLFGVLGKNTINVILITQASSEHTICIAINPEDQQRAKDAIEDEFRHEIKEKTMSHVLVEENLSIIAIVGELMHKTPGIAGKLFGALAESNINVVAIAQGSSELNISVVIRKTDETKAITVIHEAFFQKITIEPINIFLIGVGLIGGTLLHQLRESQHILRKNKLLELQVMGISNTYSMLIKKNGIHLDTWQKQLETHGIKTDIDSFVSSMKSVDKGRTIFVDCTASSDLPDKYPHILASGVSIVTPNKRGNSGSIKLYNDIRSAEKKGNTKFLYETNIGAGLPIVNTIKDFINTGDKIYKIEGIFSGTLSYLFNNFTGNKKFSEIVCEAKKNGYTEPDPRDDLNGLDFGRKLLILARELGFLIEMKDIHIENLVSEKAANAKSIDDFFEILKQEDIHFEKLKEQAKSAKKVLRYIGKITIDTQKEFSCRLEQIDTMHPFYNLSGSDNVIAIHSKRYSNTPLVIKGPGAGAEVTAAGVFADILSLIN